MKTTVTLLSFALAALGGACSSGDVAFGGVTSTCSATGTACFVLQSSGGCTLDQAATCENGSWQCSKGAVLGSGCAADGGVLRVDAAAHDAGESAACTLTQADQQSVTCGGASDPACAPYGATCEFFRAVIDPPGSGGPGGQWQCACSPVDASVVDAVDAAASCGSSNCACGAISCEQGEWVCQTCPADAGDQIPASDAGGADTAAGNCAPACASDQVCVSFYGHLGLQSASCTATPAACSNGLSCTCAAALCTAQSEFCEAASPGQLSCTDGTP